MNAFLLSAGFLLVLVFGIFLPGFLIKRNLAPKVAFTSIEALLLSFALGIGIIDFSLLVLGRLHIGLNVFTISIWYVALLLGLFLLLSLRRISFMHSPLPLVENKRGLTVAALFIALMFFVKVFYLSGTILPTSTDLGHHLYWAKLTSDTQMLPVYAKQEIIGQENNSYSLSQPEAISDFIIGEHLPLSFVHIFTGASYFGTFPLLFLFLLNIGSVLALATLAYYLGKHIVEDGNWSHIKSEHFFLLGLFVFGGLFALASPEMKFVSGGVIGNLFGNLFIPLILLVLLRALSEKSAPLFALLFLLITILAYTHHLSTFILLFILLFTAFSLLIFWHKDFFQESKKWLLAFLRPVSLGTFLSILFFAFLVALPTYLETNAVGTAVGTPTKDTRTGLTLAQLTASNSAFKLGLALAGLFLIALHVRLRKNLGSALLFGYGIVLLIMTMTPQLLLVDIPSNRIAHYLSFPLGLLALFTVLFLVEKSNILTQTKGAPLQNPLFIAGILIAWLALVAPGLEDNGKTLTINSQGLYVQETFSAARYLQEHVKDTELILKDHNFIEASDTWMKLFFSKDYNYPLSRSFFKRYEDNPGREQCTLAMIATPNTPFGKQCYQDLPVRYLVVNPHFDQAQFTKSSEFSLIYSSPNIAIFQYKQN